MSKKVENLVNQIQLNESLNSMRQVFERYPYLGELYYKELQGEDVDLTEFNRQLKEKKNLLLG